MRGSSAQKMKLTSYDDLFGGDGQASGEAVTSVPIRELHPFKGHPFRVLDDEK
ncbi:MAG TPA: chromosome partitioning protein ParB, partial [Lachnospiraceae bacterium]|nr:chromosome partitioning protein ParB [Lachnospiraceae bacterium]